MNNIEDKIIQYFEHELSREEAAQIEQLITENVEARKLFDQYKSVYVSFDQIPHQAPSDRLKQNFSLFLNEEIKQQAKSTKNTNYTKTIWMLAIGAILAAMLFFLVKNKADNQEINQQMIAMNENLTKLMQNESSSHRIKAVQISATLPDNNQQALDLLMDAMAKDPSSNVRLSALEALEKHIDNEQVRASIYKSMADETDQVVLISYINILTESKEKSAITELKKITKDQAMDQFIKDEAQLGLFQLQEY